MPSFRTSLPVSAFQTYASRKVVPGHDDPAVGAEGGGEEYRQSGIDPEFRDKLARLCIPEPASRLLLECQDPAAIRAARVALTRPACGSADAYGAWVRQGPAHGLMGGRVAEDDRVFRVARQDRPAVGADRQGERREVVRIARTRETIGCEAPEPDTVSGDADQEAPAIGAQGRVVDNVALSQGAQQPPAQVPEADRGVLAACHQSVAVGAKRHARDGCSVRQDDRLPRRGQVPEQGLAVPSPTSSLVPSRL